MKTGFSVILLLALTSLAGQFYVSPSGKDSHDGSQAAPWATLQHAAKSVAPGDTVTAAAGAYAGFYLNKSGTADARILFKALPGAIITGDNPRTPDGINLELVSYVSIEGFSVSGATRAGIRAVGTANDHAKSISIVGNRVTNNGVWGIFTGFVDDPRIIGNEAAYSQSEHGIYVSNSGDRPVIKGNVVHHNHSCGIQINGDTNAGGDGIVEGALIAGNAIYANGEAGGAAINLDGVIDSRVENNLLCNNSGGGIALFQIDGGGPSRDNKIVNNTIVQPAGARWGIAIRDGSQGNYLANNIVEQPGPKGALYISRDSLPKTSSDYNAFFGTLRVGLRSMRLAEWRQRTKLDTHSFTYDKRNLFTRAKMDYYSLAANSKAIDAGTSEGAPAKDFTGALRPAGTQVDIGAYEYIPPKN